MIRTEKKYAAFIPLAIFLLVGSAWMVWVRQQPKPLGPADGHDLPAIDTGRIRVGDVAPDFRLVAFSGDTVALSDYRDQKDVVLVFYRGHW